MRDFTFFEVLRKKYDLNDELKCEGSFNLVRGFDREVLDCVHIGLTDGALIIARPDESGDSLDYNLQAIIPLPLIRLVIQNYKEMVISVGSQHKFTKTYQLCSCEDQTNIWNQFVKFIEAIYERKILQEAADRRGVLRLKDDYARKMAELAGSQQVTNIIPSLNMKASISSVSSASKPSLVSSSNTNNSSSQSQRDPKTSATSVECPKEFKTFNEKYNMTRTFQDLDWFPKFSYKTPRLPRSVTRNDDLWSNLTGSDVATLLVKNGEEEEDLEEEEASVNLCSKITASVKAVFNRCFSWAV